MKRVDERDTMFARMSYNVGSNEYKDYYKRNPEKKVIDDEIRKKPNLCSKGTRTYDELYSPFASAPFEFLSDIKSFSDGEVNKDRKYIDNISEFTEKLKAYAKFYGANLVGITEMKDEFYYEKRGRHKENYGEVIERKDMLPYGIVFAVEMDKEKIEKAPMLDEVIATSKAYVDVATIGMVISYYLRSLGYEARNHMDANYLVRLIPVAKSAGIGEIGANGLLVTKEYGPRIRLGVVTTNLKFKADKEVDFGLRYFCEKCEICIKTCPAKAIELVDNLYAEKTYRHNQEKCYDKWRYFGTDCGICISMCPFSKKENIIKDLDTFKGEDNYIKAILRQVKEDNIRRTIIKK